MSKKIINFVGKARYFLFFSLIITFISLFLLITKGLNLSLDFTGGTIIDFSSKEENIVQEIKKLYGDVEIQKKEGGFLMKLGKSEEVSNLEPLKALPLTINKMDFIGPKVGAEFTVQAVKAVTLALIAMFIYVWIRFNWSFALGVFIALFHDLIMTLGFFSLTGYSFDLTSIAVLLTVVGYSINDSIVIYDRIRENLPLQLDKVSMINRSLNETLSRTIMTSLTTLIVCLALVVFGGESLRGFSAALSFGIAFGTYSSIYISAPILLFFKNNFNEKK
jgi:preprotein translocase SecF subunit